MDKMSSAASAIVTNEPVVVDKNSVNLIDFFKDKNFVYAAISGEVDNCYLYGYITKFDYDLMDKLNAEARSRDCRIINFYSIAEWLGGLL